MRDYREQQLLKMTNVEVFFESDLGAEDVFEIGADHVAIATGAKWRRDRFDGKTYVPVATNGACVLTPDDIMDGRLPAQGPVVVFDADNYYMGGVIAEKLAHEGLDVTYVTDSDSVSEWAGNTSERWRIRTRLMERGIRLVLAHSLTSFDGAQAELVCEYSEAVQHIPANAVVLVTQRAPSDTLYHDLLARAGEGGLPFTLTLTRIGDCEAPAIIAAAVHAGHRYATELETTVDRDEPFRHDRPVITAPVAPVQSASADPKYLETLLRAYEEEVEGEAWYRALAQRMTQPRHKEKMLLLAAVERATAEAMRPLIDRYGLTPAPREALVATGQAQAARGAQDWGTLLDQMTESFPGYVDDFKEIEAMGPAEDQPYLVLMTAHEIAAIDFLHLEAKGDPDSTAPLLDFLLATPPTSQAA